MCGLLKAPDVTPILPPQFSGERNQHCWRTFGNLLSSARWPPFAYKQHSTVTKGWRVCQPKLVKVRDVVAYAAPCRFQCSSRVIYIVWRLEHIGLRRCVMLRSRRKTWKIAGHVLSYCTDFRTCSRFWFNPILHRFIRQEAKNYFSAFSVFHRWYLSMFHKIPILFTKTRQ